MTTKNTHSKLSIPVDHVSDTAYLVAAYRLAETNRSDSLFDDHLAAKLMGSKGAEILNQAFTWKLGEWTMAIRTTLIDRLVLKWAESGIETIVNLAAGLDTRPYRLALPKTLKWVEVDLDPMIQYKNQRLKDEEPKCQLSSVSVDLSSPQEREKFFPTLKTLGRLGVITEGLLLYLTSEDVRSLSQTLHSTANLEGWITDITTASGMRAMNDFSRPSAHSAEAATPAQVDFKFLPDEGIHYFKALGWRTDEFYSYASNGKLLNRTIPEDLDQETLLKEMGLVGIGMLTK